MRVDNNLSDIRKQNNNAILQTSPNQRKEATTRGQGFDTLAQQGQVGRQLDDKSRDSIESAANSLVQELEVAPQSVTQQASTQNSITGTNQRDNLTGTDGNDTIKGLAGNDSLKGLGGADRIFGGDGADRLYGNDGDDLLSGGNDNDRLIGGAGADRLYGEAGDDKLYGNDGDDRLIGGDGKDRLVGGNGSDRLYGGNDNDRLYGNNGNDTLLGGAGDDLLYGGRGNDRLFGNEGNDTLKGGRGDDLFLDNEGNNTFIGGSGHDEVRFNGNFEDYSIRALGRDFIFENKITGNTNTVKSVESFIFNDQRFGLSTLKEVFNGTRDTRYHSVDGSFNNLRNPDIGKVDSPYRNVAPKDSAREIGGSEEVNLPNPRDISNAVFAQDGNTENTKGLSDMFWLWGQFMDHDIDLTPTVASDKANIAIPKGDPLFDPEGTGDKTMDFERSVHIVDDQGQRKQTNRITAVVDGSNIYGSSQEVQDEVRSKVGGKLTVDANNRMPKNAEGQFVSGDVRVNENVGLTSMHTIWVREHNRVADQLATDHPSWNDNKLFQEARKKVVGEMQAISNNEYYPAVLGGQGLTDYKGYNPDVSPQISNEFASAAYRFGHTMLSSTILRLDEQGNEIPEGNLALRNAFFRPDKVDEAGIDPILRGFSAHTAQAADAKLVDDVRNFLFGPPGSGGFDLASLNIQRGRDHGISSYNDVREAIGLSRINSFSDPIFKGDSGQRLASVYSSPDQIDLWVGGLAETAKDEGLFGSTFSTILQDQFSRLRDGDRFWYQNRFSGSELNELNNLKLSDVIKRNTNIQNIQDNVFIASGNIAQPDNTATTAAIDSASATGSDGTAGSSGVTTTSGAVSQPRANTEVIRNVAEIATNTLLVSDEEAAIIIGRALEGEAAELALVADAVVTDAELRQAGILPKELELLLLP